MLKSVLTLGTFDGVHRGHQALFKKVIQRARARRAIPMALAFDMPPRHAGEPLSKSVLLSTLDEKRRLVKDYGIKRLQLLTFDRKTASTPPERFFQDTILRQCRACEMIVGPKVAFGKNRAGRLPLLKKLGKKFDIAIHVVKNVHTRFGSVSSRRIRALLAAGKIEKANALLGYAYAVEGRVIHGSHRGRTMKFPTANIDVDPRKILPPGVFFVKVQPGGLDGLCNVGTRPTFTPKSHTLHCEVFLLKGHGSLYGKSIRVVFLRRLRAERRFSSSEALKRQIRRDLSKAQLYRKAHFSI